MLSIIKYIFRRVIPVAIVVAWPRMVSASNTWKLASPDGRCSIDVTLGAQGELSFSISRAGRTVIPASPMGLVRDDQAFQGGLALKQAGKVEKRHESYSLFTGNVTRVDQVLKHRSVAFQNGQGAILYVDLAAGNEGVAFRYRFDGQSLDEHIVRSELTGFTFPVESQGWLQPYHAAGLYTPAYEDFYYAIRPGDAPPRARGKPLGWAFPVLYHVPSSRSWVLLTESGNDGSYCACHLDAGSTNGLYRIAFPASDEGTRGQTFSVGPEPRHTLPWAMPWRVFVLGGSAGEIAMSTLVTDLAVPSQIKETSWIKPGRASWSWWSYPEGPNTAARYDEFSDFAARMRWEYTLFDGGWWEAGLAPIARHAVVEGVMPLAWSFAGDFYSPEKRRAKLDEMATAGVRGVKVDFWCSDRQEAIAAMQALFEEAAARKMVVDLHGCTLPRGWQRTWPNFLSAEAVVGAESYFYEAQYTQKAAELNAVLPFTRNAVGPMDITPVGCSPKKYRRLTTAAHELASSLVFTSGLLCYADQPSFYESLPPEVVAVLRDAPANWAESRCLLGEPGKVAVFARRTGKTWFIAGLNGTAGRLPVDLDLSAYHAFRQRTLIVEGGDASMQVGVQSVPVMSHWRHEIPARGGFILRLER